MKTTRTICDRCGQCIVAGGSVVQLEAGGIRDKLHQPVDLCEGCASGFVDWLKSGHPDVAAPGPPTYMHTPGVPATRTSQYATDDATGEWPVSTANAPPRAVQAAGSGR